MVVCVAEKPSVGQYIAKVLGATQRHEGYMEGNGYQVTWTFGHLCGLLDPNDYTDQWKGWNLSSLPMIPARFGIKVVGDEGVHKQFHIIESLIAQADRVINCGDAGQEGELIQRWVYQKAGCHCPVDRLWVSSLTEEAIAEGFRNLKPQDDYQHLYEAGLMRAIGDWLLGMNATRAYTLRYASGVGRDRQVLSVGRVQTPTLALIVRRQEEIEHFVPKTYFELKTVYRGTTFSMLKSAAGEDSDAVVSDSEAEKEHMSALLASITGQPFVVDSVEKKKGLEYAPKLFDLTSLQVECNRRYSMTAEQTLNLIQSLYEKRVTTYPRVDTTYLPDDIYPKVPATLRGIADFYPAAKSLEGQKLPKTKRVFDTSKVTDHHAIIPTGVRPDNLTADERKVFDLIALRFIAAFYPDCQVSNTTVLAHSAEVPFRVTGREVLVPGWRDVLDTKDDSRESRDSRNSSPSDEEEEKALPSFVVGETGSHEPKLLEKTTQPPKYYTEATLLRAMETAGKTVEDEALREALKENGIGRPSTRSAIIEKLFQRKYIVRKGKQIHATETGINLIHTIISPLLKSAELTGLWERKMRDIEAGTYTAQQMLEELKELTRSVVLQVKLNKAGQRCPVCGRGLIIRGRTRYGCSRWREGCNYSAEFE